MRKIIEIDWDTTNPNRIFKTHEKTSGSLKIDLAIRK
jgi:hypothetical protein